MSLIGTLAKMLVPQIAQRLLDRLLPVRLPRREAVNEEPSMPWTHKTVDHVEAQIRSATSPRAITRNHAADAPKPGPQR